MPRRRSVSTPLFANSHPITDLIIEAVWLFGLVSVPLVFNPNGWLSFYADPKYVALHVAALVIAVVWAWERALFAQPVGLPNLREARVWMGRRPGRWALVAAGALALTAILSTAASPVKTVSLWGRDFTDLGYELYSFLSLLVIFFAVAMRMRTKAQARRLLIAFAVVGTVAAVYAISQRFNWDPLGPGLRGGRVFASFGNAINLGAFLVMTAIITPAIVLAEDRGARYMWLVVGALALGIQLAGLWYAGSRGPWIGYSAGIAAFGAAGIIWIDRRTLGRGLALMIGGLAIAFLIVQIPQSENNKARFVENDRTFSDVGRIFGNVSTDSFGGRGVLWESGLTLSVERPWSPEEGKGVGIVRSLLGYGPEMFFYAYPLGIEIDPSGTIAQHSHNYPLQLFIELGALGLGSLIALVLLALYAGLKLLNVLKKSGADQQWMVIIVVGVLAALTGRGVEQMVGVGRLGDLMPFWMLLGLLIALVEIAAIESPETADGAGTAGSRNVRRASRARSSEYVYVAIALLITLVAAGLLYFRDGRGIQASYLAQDAATLRREGRLEEALDKYQKAAELNPHVEQYHLAIADILRGSALFQEAEGNEDLERLGWELTLDASQKYADRNGKAFNTQLRIGQAESRLVGLGRNDIFESARNTYLEIAAARPSYPSVQSAAALGFLAIGDNQLGLLYADRAISMETSARPDSQSWRYRGVALENLSELELASAAYETAIERRPGSPDALFSHQRLVVVYGALGETERASAQQALVDGFK